MKKTLAAGAVLGAMLLPALPANAAPNGNGLQTFETIDCGTVTTGGGASFYVEGQKYLTETFTGTFTPAGGSPETVTKTYGNRTGQTGASISCSGSGDDGHGGTFSFTVTGVAP